MPLELHIIQASEFIRTDAAGGLDFDATTKRLKGLVDMMTHHQVSNLLIDASTRSEEQMLGIGSLYKVIESMGELGFKPIHKIALVHPHHYSGKVEFVATAAQNRGWNVRAFGRLEEALHWLTGSRKVLLTPDANEGTPSMT